MKRVIILVTTEAGKKSTVYNYYVVYACDEGVWSNLVAKYLYDVIGILPETKTQQTMAGLFQEIDQATRNETPRSPEQFRSELSAQQEALRSGGIPSAQQQAAYQSGDPARVAAASTTAADANYVAALSLMAGAK
jgi:hypothetical protein